MVDYLTYKRRQGRRQRVRALVKKKKNFGLPSKGDGQKIFTLKRKDRLSAGE